MGLFVQIVSGVKFHSFLRKLSAWLLGVLRTLGSDEFSFGDAECEDSGCSYYCSLWVL
jgi:hypothetical protein